MTIPPSLYAAVFNSLEEQIAILDHTGSILETNVSWQKFGSENGLSSAYECVKQNYLEVLSESSAAGDNQCSELSSGIQEVLSGEREFLYFEYPCHSPTEQRWFTMRIAALKGNDCEGLFVISHHNITQRKLAEQRVEELAIQDPLTGLGNRRAFQLFLNKSIRNGVRSRTPISLILIDVDYFKSYNDTFGHAAGDHCLTNIGQVLLAHARRSNDLAARIGGDEFALVLFDVNLEMAKQVAQSISRKINDLKMIINDSQQVTVSIGLTSGVPHQGCDEAILFQQADEALYAAKSAGRDQVADVRIDCI